MSYSTEELHKLDKQYYLPTFRRYPLAFKKGKGSRLWDMEGNEYIDALAGIAVNNLGHAHPKLAEAISKQANELIHISNFYVSEPQIKLAKKLADLSGLQRVFFGNSGAEAAEGAIKIARKYASKNGRGGTIIAMKNAFHGRTLAALAATGKEAMMQGFAPIPEGFCHVPFNDMDLLKEKVNDDVAGIMLEPIQGEGGVNPVDPVFLKELRQYCDEQNIVLIFDEVQCGMGRTGHWFAHEHFDVKPDVMTLAKALGGGVPIGAVLASERVGSAIDWGDHGTTYGGNPLVCSAALACIEVTEEEDLMHQAVEKGAWLKDQIEKVKPDYPEIKEVRGYGLMLGIELTVEAKPIVVAMMNHKVLANATAGNVVRLVPPLNIPMEDWKTVFEVLLQSIKELR
ncbi:aspartate aminotransferase family protein [Marinoscillum furvescens]|uniref:Acetylornithine aminotransferase n=1 Tax=Marinoscillum furvescens DSM 4134 TaxID=1122208 RepID=A0A3D9L685_MARFU|nr:aspartate aminotransferase family protein [Marinoscillum furvescens]REE00107.1 acetylornithine aminotransferase [Marinoscillum furvescens DSM 4134]